MRLMVRLSTATLASPPPAARRARAKSYRFFMGLPAYRPRRLKQETSILVIRSSPTIGLRCLGSSPACPCWFSLAGGGAGAHPLSKRSPRRRRRVMNLARKLSAFAVSVLAVSGWGLSATAEQPTKIEFSGETVGAEPKSLLSVVGVWRVENEGSKKVLAVDGRQWKEGQASAGIADKARALYGERYAEFL